jgi:hypothetical protein
MCWLLEGRRVNEIPVDSMQCSSSFLGLGWYASVFQGLFFYAEPDLLVVSRKIEPGLVKGDNERPTMVSDGPELAQDLNL